MSISRKTFHSLHLMEDSADGPNLETSDFQKHGNLIVSRYPGGDLPHITTAPPS
jgi:hypothetical protein